MSTEVLMEVDAILFDMDGTLMDSSAACARIWGRWAAHYGLNTDEVIHVSHGRRPEDTATIILGEDADIEAAVKLFTIEEAKEKEVKTILGAKELTNSLPHEKWAVVTSSTENIAKERFLHCGIPLPKSLITAEKVANGKPHPEGYLKAAQELNVDIKNCVVIEDAPGGVEAGHNAGAKVIVMATTFKPSQFPNEMIIYDLTALQFKLGENGKIKLKFTPVSQ